MPGITLILVLELSVLAANPVVRFGETTGKAGPTRVAVSPDFLIGYTELRTNLQGGRHANVITMRAMVVKADGTGRRALAESLTGEPNTWSQFAGWSPDGRTAFIGRGWESPENGAWEEEHKTFRFNADGWLYDMFLLDLASGKLTNLTAVDRASFHNSALFFSPNDRTNLPFPPPVHRTSHPF